MTFNNCILSDLNIYINIFFYRVIDLMVNEITIIIIYCTN